MSRRKLHRRYGHAGAPPGHFGRIKVGSIVRVRGFIKGVHGAYEMNGKVGTVMRLTDWECAVKFNVPVQPGYLPKPRSGGTYMFQPKNLKVIG